MHNLNKRQCLLEQAIGAIHSASRGYSADGHDEKANQLSQLAEDAERLREPAAVEFRARRVAKRAAPAGAVA